jgi:hypothetical protein
LAIIIATCAAAASAGQDLEKDQPSADASSSPSKRGEAEKTTSEAKAKSKAGQAGAEDLAKTGLTRSLTAKDENPPQNMVRVTRELGSSEMAVCILAFLMFCGTIGCASYLRHFQLISADIAFKLIGLGVIIGASTFLVGAGYDTTVMGPVMGFLGTALGFIFGRRIEEPAPPAAPGRSAAEATGQGGAAGPGRGSGQPAGQAQQAEGGRTGETRGGQP